MSGCCASFQALASRGGTQDGLRMAFVSRGSRGPSCPLLLCWCVTLGLGSGGQLVPGCPVSAMTHPRAIALNQIPSERSAEK